MRFFVCHSSDLRLALDGVWTHLCPPSYFCCSLVFNKSNGWRHIAEVRPDNAPEARWCDALRSDLLLVEDDAGGCACALGDEEEATIHS